MNDKMKHFIVGALIVTVSGWWNIWFALVFCILAGVLKELYDIATGKGTPEWMDLWATLGGGVFVALVYWSWWFLVVIAVLVIVVIILIAFMSEMDYYE